MFFGIFGDELAQVHKLPLHGWQRGRLRQADGVEIRPAVMKAQQEFLRSLIGKTGPNIGDKPLPCHYELIDSDGDGRHAEELLRVRFV
jgi:hypothetical protein